MGKLKFFSWGLALHMIFISALAIADTEGLESGPSMDTEMSHHSSSHDKIRCRGPRGPTGSTGITGTGGIEGVGGAAGAAGAAGVQGAQGPTGVMGGTGPSPFIQDSPSNSLTFVMTVNFDVANVNNIFVTFFYSLPDGTLVVSGNSGAFVNGAGQTFTDNTFTPLSSPEFGNYTFGVYINDIQSSGGGIATVTINSLYTLVTASRDGSVTSSGLTASSTIVGTPSTSQGVLSYNFAYDNLNIP